MLLTDFELKRKLQRAARLDRDPLWDELYNLASVLAVLGAFDEALALWRALYESEIPLPKPLDISIYGDLIVSAVCHQLEVPDLSRGHPPSTYVNPGSTLAARVEAYDAYVRAQLTADGWPDRDALEAARRPMPALDRYRHALQFARPRRGECYSPTEVKALPLLQEDLDEPSQEPPYVGANGRLRSIALLLTVDIAARHGDAPEATRRLREWYDVAVEFPGNCSLNEAFGLRAVAALICARTLADKTAIPRAELRALVAEVLVAPARRVYRLPRRLPEVDELPRFLDRILARLEELGRPLPQLLQPGLTRAQIDAHTAHLPFRLPEEVCRLYMWRNGTATGEDVLLADIVLFDSKHFLPLEEALEIHRQIPQDPDHYSDVYDPELVEALDGATLFPLFSDGFGGYYTVACRPEPSQTGLMIDDFGGGAEPRLAFPSLTRMMSVLADLYEAGVEAPFLEEEDST